MSDKRISFTAWSIQAYQAGLKTQTRRVIKFDPENLRVDNGKIWKRETDGPWFPWLPVTYSPYGQPGDRLAFCEGYQITSSALLTTHVSGRYLSDDAPFRVELTRQEFAKWSARKFPYRATPGRFMYRSLVRYRPEILSVRVERVQEIADEDAEAEGIYSADGAHVRDCVFAEPGHHYPGGDGGPYCSCGENFAREEFARLWDSINAKRGFGWDVNPFVWVVEFEKVEVGE